MNTKIKFFPTGLLLITIVTTMSRCQTHPVKDVAVAVATDTTTVAADTATAAIVPPKDTIAPQMPLTLVITNLATPDASVEIGVYGTKNKFPDPKGQLKVYKFKPHGLKLTAKITDLPFGTYALAIYQDVNGAGKISKNLIGIPTDPYAFSNNYKPTIKAPNFNDCKFDYDAKENTVAMNMIR